jgi:hypothetical protein
MRRTGRRRARAWERFLGGLIRRGLIGDRREVIRLGGRVGLLAALPAYPGVPVKRCRSYKIRDALARARLTDQPAIKADLHAVTNASTLPRARRRAARRFADRWVPIMHASLACWTTSLVILAVVAKSDGAPSPWASSPMDHILFAVFQSRKPKSGRQHPLLLTQTSFGATNKENPHEITREEGCHLNRERLL